MPYTITPKDVNKRILLITLSNPFDFRNEAAHLMDDLHNTLGNITNTVYAIYDLREITLNVEGIINAVASFARPKNDFEKQLMEHGRMVFVGLGTFVNLGARTASRFTPGRQFPIFQTLDEAVSYAQTELAKQ